MNYILREIKLSKLTDTPISDEATKLIKFWNDLWCDMKVSIDTDKGEIKCWKEDYDYYYFQQDDKNDYFWCDYYEIWIFFRDDLELTYNETQELIQHMVAMALNHKANVPRFSWRRRY